MNIALNVGTQGKISGFGRGWYCLQPGLLQGCGGYAPEWPLSTPRLDVLRVMQGLVPHRLDLLNFHVAREAPHEALRKADAPIPVNGSTARADGARQARSPGRTARHIRTRQDSRSDPLRLPIRARQPPGDGQRAGANTHRVICQSKPGRSVG